MSESKIVQRRFLTQDLIALPIGAVCGCSCQDYYFNITIIEHIDGNIHGATKKIIFIYTNKILRLLLLRVGC